MRSFRLFLAIVFAVSLALPRAVFADEKDSSLGLMVFGEELPSEDLRSRLERDLKRPVVLLKDPSTASASFVTVSWRRERKELAVSYTDRTRGTVSRVIAAKDEASENVESAALLAESLCENEAASLIGAAPQIAPPPPPVNPSSLAPSPEPRAGEETLPASVSLVYPLATNYAHPYAPVRFGFNLLYGRAGSVPAGLQIGLVNAVIGEKGRATGNVSGLQLAPLYGFNYASGTLSGLQLGFIGNAAGDGVSGAQVGGVNVSARGLEGIQIGLVTNVAAASVQGAQVSAVNVAGDLDGVQVGVVNVAGKVRGVLVGLVNVADDIDGVPIGVLSVTKTGGIHPVAWASTESLVNAGLKFATKHTYSMLAFHYAPLGALDVPAEGARPAETLSAKTFVGGGFFVGGHIPLGRAFIDLDLGFSAMASPERSFRTLSTGALGEYHEIILDSRARAMVGYEIAPHFSLFAGGGGLGRLRLVDDADFGVLRIAPEIFGGIQF